MIERERKQARQKRQQEQQMHQQQQQQQEAQPFEETEVKRSLSAIAQSAPPQRVTTPVKVSKYELLCFRI